MNQQKLDKINIIKNLKNNTGPQFYSISKYLVKYNYNVIIMELNLRLKPLTDQRHIFSQLNSHVGNEVS